jgi:hypothetical protein
MSAPVCPGDYIVVADSDTWAMHPRDFDAVYGPVEQEGDHGE